LLQLQITHQAQLIQRAVGLNDLAGPPAAGGITKGQGAAGHARVCDEAHNPEYSHTRQVKQTQVACYLLIVNN